MRWRRHRRRTLSRTQDPGPRTQDPEELLASRLLELGAELTAAERRVLPLMVTGKNSAAAIARQLQLARQTVDATIQRILTKAARLWKNRTKGCRGEFL